MRCGVGDYTAMLCQHLARAGSRVRVLTSQEAGPAAKSGEENLQVLPRVGKWSLACLPLIRRTVQEVKPQVINIQWPTAAYGRSVAVNLLPAYLRLLFPKVPVVATIHELRYFKPLTRLRLLPSLALCSRLVIIDPLDLPVISRLFPPALARCRHVPIGSSLPPVPKDFNRSERRQRLGFAEQDFVVGFFGFANAPKGLETLFAALRRLKDSQPRLRLLLMSQLSEQNAYQRRLRRDLNITGLDAITVNPEYAEPHLAAEILACADCAALPFVDGASVKRASLIACLTQGLPIVTTQPARGEVWEFTDRVNMLLVPSKNAAALAQAIRLLTQDADLRARLSLGAWDLAGRFAWEDIARQQTDIFREVSGVQPA